MKAKAVRTIWEIVDNWRGIKVVPLSVRRETDTMIYVDQVSGVRKIDKRSVHQMSTIFNTRKEATEKMRYLKLQSDRRELRDARERRRQCKSELAKLDRQIKRLALRTVGRSR
jgi:hypothetical protein